MNLFIHAFIYFGILTVFIYVGLLIKPRIWLHRMPPTVRSKVPEKTAREKMWFAILGIPLGCVFFFYPAVVTSLLYTRLDHIFLSLFVFTAGFAIWDTLILDLLIFCKITPKSMIISGTTAQDYKDKMYHVKSGFKGLIMALVYTVLVGLIIYVTTQRS